MHFTDYLQTLSILYYKRFLNILPFLKHQHYTPFIILCHARTGSTLLHTYLNSHPAIVSLGEQPGPYIREARHKVNSHYLQENIFCAQPKPIQAVGIKFFYEYTIYPRGEALLSELLKVRSLKVIVLKRENMLRAIISSQIADKTGYHTSWSSKHDFATEDKKLYVDTSACVAQLIRMEEEQKTFEELFHDHQRLYLSYEQLLSDKSGTLENVQRFLKVKPVKLLSLLRKQNPEPLSQLVLNFEELKQALKATPWEKLAER